MGVETGPKTETNTNLNTWCLSHWELRCEVGIRDATLMLKLLPKGFVVAMHQTHTLFWKTHLSSIHLSSVPWQRWTWSLSRENCVRGWNTPWIRCHVYTHYRRRSTNQHAFGKWEETGEPRELSETPHTLTRAQDRTADPGAVRSQCYLLHCPCR